MFYWLISMFCWIVCFRRHNLKVREHTILGPYVDGLSTLAVSSFKVRHLENISPLSQLLSYIILSVTVTIFQMVHLSLKKLEKLVDINFVAYTKCTIVKRNVWSFCYVQIQINGSEPMCPTVHSVSDGNQLQTEISLVMHSYSPGGAYLRL